MRLRRSFTDKEIKQWIKERDKASLSYDVKKFRQFYVKWQMAGIYQKTLSVDDNVVEIMMRKMVYHIDSATPEQKAEAKKWLEDHGCNTSL